MDLSIQPLKCVYDFAVHKPGAELFSAIEGYDDIKEYLLRVINAEGKAVALLLGPPATGKSLFLLETTNKVKDAYYFSGATMSGRGLLDFLHEHKGAKILCIDENRQAQQARTKSAV